MINTTVAILIACLAAIIVAETFIIYRKCEQVAELRNKLWKANQPLLPVMDFKSWWDQR